MCERERESVCAREKETDRERECYNLLSLSVV